MWRTRLPEAGPFRVPQTDQGHGVYLRQRGPHTCRWFPLLEPTPCSTHGRIKPTSKGQLRTTVSQGTAPGVGHQGCLQGTSTLAHCCHASSHSHTKEGTHQGGKPTCSNYSNPPKLKALAQCNVLFKEWRLANSRFSITTHPLAVLILGAVYLGQILGGKITWALAP